MSAIKSCKSAASIGAIVFSAFTISGCEQRTPKVADEDIALLKEMFPNMAESCVEKIRYDGLDAMPAGVDECFEMQESRQWSGLLRNDFEGSRFCPQPATKCSFRTRGEKIWLTFSDDVNSKSEVIELGDDALYRITFVGRLTAKSGKFGHFGASERHIIVDQLTSLGEADPSSR